MDAERYIKDNFRLLLGKVFAPYSDSHEESTYYSLALTDPDAMPTKTAADIKRRDAVVKENDAVYECLQDAFLIEKMLMQAYVEALACSETKEERDILFRLCKQTGEDMLTLLDLIKLIEA